MRSFILLSSLLLQLGCTRTPEPPTATPGGELTTRAHVEGTIRPAPEALASLLAFEDTDGDRRITVKDEGARWFDLPLLDGGSQRIAGVYPLANAVQELFLAHREHRDFVPLQHIFEPLPERISRLIRTRYWRSLTRRIDGASLEQVLADSKVDGRGRPHRPGDPWPASCTAPPKAESPLFLYVPATDVLAFDYYAKLATEHPRLVVCRLPQDLTPEWVRSLSATASRPNRHGLLSLALEKRAKGELTAVPYVVPGGRFNELYGWDSYFHVLGLLEDGDVELARSIVDNQLYEIRHYGKVLNANRTYYLTRSQPPLSSSAVRAVWNASPRKDEVWLRSALSALEREYHEVWNDTPRATPLCTQANAARVCLATYSGEGIGEPPEVEPGHYDWLYAKRALSARMDAEEYRDRYHARSLPEREMGELDEFFLHDRAMRESGHDTTYRFWTEAGDECANFATVDLNALLFKVELDLAALSREALDGNEWATWCDRAQARRTLVQKYLHDGELFVDHRLRRREGALVADGGEQSRFVSATTLYPLWASADSPCKDAAGEPLTLFRDRAQAERLVRVALEALEVAGGLAGSSESSRRSVSETRQRQWDYPHGWAPHQVLAWVGLRRHGFEREAERLSYRWLYTIARNVHDYHGTIPEKFDVVTRSHQVFAEYGNVGTDFSYITEEGFGWMNASFQLGRRALSPQLLTQLSELTPPEQLF